MEVERVVRSEGGVGRSMQREWSEQWRLKGWRSEGGMGEQSVE